MASIGAYHIILGPYQHLLYLANVHCMEVALPLSPASIHQRIESHVFVVYLFHKSFMLLFVISL